MLLEVKELTVSYDAAKALYDVNIHIKQGEFISILGPNGAGKSTLLKAIAGVLKPLRGEVIFEGKSIGGLEPRFLIDQAIVYIPQGKRVFPSLTVHENVEVMLHSFEAKKRKEVIEEVFSLFPVLKERAKILAGRLSSGEQQVVALARAMAAKPKLLLLDEPSHGLSPLWAEQVFNKIMEIGKRQVSVALVEQNIEKALEMAARGYILKNGRIVREGPAEELAAKMVGANFSWAET